VSVKNAVWFERAWTAGAPAVRRRSSGRRDKEVVGSSSRIGGDVLERVLRRAEGLRREWAEDEANGDGDEAQGATEAVQGGLDSHDLSPEEDRVLEALRVASRPLGKSEVLGRTRIAGTAWWSTIGSLRRRGLIIQEELVVARPIDWLGVTDCGAAPETRQHLKSSSFV
jgi:hypothetical protein